MTDIVDEMKSWRDGRGYPTPGEKIINLRAEVDRLQRSVIDWKLEAEVHRKRAAAAVAEIARLRLTEAERSVLRGVRDSYADEDDVRCNEIAFVLNDLLARLDNDTKPDQSTEGNT